MAGLSDVFSTLTGWFKDIVGLLLGFALVLLVVELLFLDTIDYSIVENLIEFIERFTNAGVVGLIAFIAFAAVYRS